MSYTPVKGELSNSLPVQISTAEALCGQLGNILAFSRNKELLGTPTHTAVFSPHSSSIVAPWLSQPPTPPL